MEPNAERSGDPSESPGQSRGVDHGATAPFPDAGEIARRVQFGPDLFLIQESGVVAEPPLQVRTLAHPIDLMRLGRDRDLAGIDPIALDTEPSHEGFDALEVLGSETFDRLDLVGEPGDPVLEAVGQRCVAEAPVASAGTERDRVGFQDQDVAVGVVLLRLDRRPQAGETRADDHQVRGRGRCQRRMGGGRVRTVEPEGKRFRIGVGPSER